jgi:hypothetical protein
MSLNIKMIIALWRHNPEGNSPHFHSVETSNLISYESDLKYGSLLSVRKMSILQYDNVRTLLRTTQ